MGERRSPGHGATVVEALADLILTLRSGTARSELQDAIDELGTALTSTCGPIDLSGVWTSVSRVWLELNEDQRNQAELQRLVRAAQQFLGSEDLDSLLRAIVEAARDLLAADVAHLNLFRDDGADRRVVRAIDGAMSEAFRRQQTPPGAGLTGLITRTKSPYVTEDYEKDTNIHHDPRGDASVKADQLRTMAGVPLLKGRSVTGVLIVSYRKVSKISSRQMSLLTSLAALASVAVDNANANEQRLENYRQLRAAHDAARRTNSLLEWSAAAHDQLTGLILAGADFPALAQTVRWLFNAPVSLVASTGVVLASVDEELTDAAAMDQLAKVGELKRPVRTQDGSGARWAAPGVAGGEIMGLVTVHRDALTDIEQRTLERCGMTLALLLATQRAVEEADNRLASEVVEDLLQGGERAESAARRAASLGLDPHGACLVIVAQHAAPERQELRRWTAQLNRRLGGLASVGSTHVSLVVPGEDTEGVVTEISRLLAGNEGLSVTVGVSNPSHRVGQLVVARSEASKCARALRRLGHTNGVASVERLGFLGLLLGEGRSGDIAAYVESTLGPVVEYDGRKSSHLLETVEIYLEEGHSLKKTARRMHVHTNTVLQRLHRVSALLGDDWQSNDKALQIQVALHLRRLTPVVDEP